MEDFLILAAFILSAGACIGSFLNVVALRALTNESIVFPSSKCPKCNTPIKWYDNIPVLSYLFTFKGKCRRQGPAASANRRWRREAPTAAVPPRCSWLFPSAGR